MYKITTILSTHDCVPLEAIGYDPEAKGVAGFSIVAVDETPKGRMIYTLFSSRMVDNCLQPLVRTGLTDLDFDWSGAAQ